MRKTVSQYFCPGVLNYWIQSLLNYVDALSRVGMIAMTNGAAQVDLLGAARCRHTLVSVCGFLSHAWKWLYCEKRARLMLILSFSFTISSFLLLRCWQMLGSEETVSCFKPLQDKLHAAPSKYTCWYPK